MKLYFSPGACSLSPHITALEAGLDVTLIKVDTKTKKLEDGSDFLAINPKGQVPTLVLDDGDVVTEGPVIAQILADLAPASNLAPGNGTKARYKLQEWLNFITSELHKGYSPLFKPTTPDDYKPVAKAQLADRYAFVDGKLAGKKYLLGDTFTVADAYLFTVSNWAKFVGVDLSAFGNLTAFMARVAERPQVQAALKAEGLTK
ncbi:glutathione transferase GstA [Dongia rigui]|uniref:Glutathione transferase GstA n=1 Tax=Dongia rigui TaxID=940149 RepID=A0ABU5DZ71_9PROT|nr:glutathione transferase GstA [Dongia rigui]MDY0871938.1 glutathione transferase GstA [Dongia rigui]